MLTMRPAQPVCFLRVVYSSAANNGRSARSYTANHIRAAFFPHRDRGGPRPIFQILIS
jgi:hypothetical protein